ncbi:MAG: chromosomal replication initiator protein DnaA [Oscillospiraceae bacterium]|nr:chromosomal replication initiator protein DnaA [Oscillospiraceae bacterium]
MESREDVLQFVLDYMAERTSRTVVKAWFSETEMVGLTESGAVIRTPAPFKRDILRERYAEPVREALRELFGVPMDVDFIAGDDPAPDPGQPEKSGCGGVPYYRQQYTFDRFVVGKSNDMAYGAARNVADNPGGDYNPLFLYGGSGLGKTHLLFAIANQLRVQRPELRVLDFTGEIFTNELATAIRQGTTPAFREKYRTADVILCDDIQFIEGKDFSQEEFFHTFNALHQVSGQIVVTSDRPPKHLPLLEERLRTRFDAGLLVDVQSPDFETRMAIVKSTAARTGLRLGDDVIVYIAQSVTNNVRQLEGFVKKMTAYRDMMGNVSLEGAQKALNEIVEKHPGLRPTPDYVLGKVCEYYRADKSDVLGKGRQARLVQVRQVGMYIVRKMTDISLQGVGDFFNRDHSTVLYGVEKMERDRDSNPALDTEITEIMENIRSV